MVLLLTGSDLTSFLVDLVSEIFGWWSLLLLLAAVDTSLLGSVLIEKNKVDKININEMAQKMRNNNWSLVALQ